MAQTWRNSPRPRKPLGGRGRPRPAPKRAGTPDDAILGLQQTAGNAATVAYLHSLQRDTVPTLTLPPSFAFQVPGAEDLIAGPLPPGTVRESHGLTVSQLDAQHVEISYGRSTVRLDASPGDVYAFSVGPPIAGPPKPAAPFGSLVLPDPDAKPDLPQRLVRVSSTASVVEQQVDESARVAPLAVQSRIVSAAEVRDTHPEIPTMIEVIESVDADHAQLQLEESMLRIEAPANADAEGEPGAGSGHPPFAYWIDPEWTGPHADQRRVTIVAAPGVRVRTGSPEHAPVIVYGRSLTHDVVRVPHRALIPAQGTRLTLDQFVGVETVDPNAAETPSLPGLGPEPDGSQHADAVNIGTGMAGVSIVHPWSGARVSIRPTDAEVGAAYAWQVVAPVNGLPGQIRAVVGPGVTVSLAEPVPYRLRDHDGRATMTPKPGQASTGEGLNEQSFEFQLVEVTDPAKVPVQGAPLNIDYLLNFGNLREPDQHAWLDTNDLPYRLATAGFDLIVGLIPIVGQLYLIGEFAYTMATGHDWWGNDVDDGGKVVMGMGAALSLIPLVGGLRALLTGAAEASKVAEFAARWGMTAEELQAVLGRVAVSVSGEDAALVQRAARILEKGGSMTEEELNSLRAVLGKVGAGGVALEGLALSATGNLELALASGGTPLRSENYLAQLLSDFRTTGKVSDDLVAPLARSGHFGNAEEAEMAIRQALRDLARSEGVAADEALVNATAKSAGEAVVRAQAAAIETVAPQTRTLAVSQPQLVAQYEQLVNQRLPAVIQDVMAGQRSTPGRVRLVQLRQQFDQLRTQVGGANRLTQPQRDLANQLLRDARDLARDDFNNVRDAVWRRLRNARQNPDLAQIEQRLRAAGDVGSSQTGAMQLRMVDPAGTPRFESMNIEHRVRLSDNPWLYNDANNLLLSDSAQNQQYLEGLRQQGSIWPNDAVEEFVVRFRLNDQGIDFAPQSR